MKTTDYLIIGALGIGAFLLYKSSQQKGIPYTSGEEAVILGAATPQAVTLPASNFLYSTPQKAQDSINYIQKQAQKGETVYFTSENNKIIGIQDAKKQMSYSVAAMTAPKVSTPAPRTEVSKITPYINIPKTPYSVPTSILKKK